MGWQKGGSIELSDGRFGALGREFMMALASADEIHILRQSGQFDEAWYLATYPDVAALGIDPIVHYLWLGARLGRDPSPDFSTQAYLETYFDVAAVGCNPFVHYVSVGRFEGRVAAPARMVALWHGDRPRKVERRSFARLDNPAARVIAFYLPQYHPIAENDAWWGKGFTEWSGVKPAVPHFAGHYQPHVPHRDIGYYSLLDKNAQRKQIELAKAYGIEGFCFYYYWFAGHRLLERPIEAWLADASLDHPFCLCWANENWSRRWDGLESEVLIGQDHSPADDLAVMADMARYIRDPRYIRVDGKPLLILYRPSLLPDVAATARRWRTWCRENGIGEIFLAYTQSFEKEDPRRYGFDAAIEFTPNNSSPPDVTDTVVPLESGFSGRVYDWSIFPKRSENYHVPDYTYFRSVCPGWDNTPRRKERGICFVNNTPELYRRWLDNAVRDAVLRFDKPDERLIFVNAWNEWGEGAHLEPDEANGYAYLEATREALAGVPRAPSVALVIHAFYPDVLDEILNYAARLPASVKMFVSTVPEREAEVRARLEQAGRPWRLFVDQNRGRDVLPFLRVLAALDEEGVEFFAKVHTKRSLHRSDGEQWRSELYDAVIGLEAFCRGIAAMQADDRLGMLGPQGHLVSMDTYLGSNQQRIEQLAQGLGVDPATILDYPFFAGTMFIARTAALIRLLGLGLDAGQFDPEAGQIDGTLAHAIERALGICVRASGYRLAFSGDPAGEAVVNNRYGFA